MSGFVVSSKLHLCCSRLSSKIPKTLFCKNQTHYVPVRQYPRVAAADSSGKTTITILNTEEGAPLMINSYSVLGFRLNNNMRVVGPVAIFPKTVLCWNIGGPEAITCETLSLFTILAPKLDFLIIGLGDTTQDVDTTWVKALREKGVNLEIYTTEHACSVFNFLNQEGRAVAAVILPPKKMKITGDDLANSKTMSGQTMFENKMEWPKDA